MAKRDKNGRWKKGESPNPGGSTAEQRRAKRAVSQVAQDILNAKCDIKDKDGDLKYGDKSRLEALFIRLYGFSMANGNMLAAKLLLEYAYGKPVQPIAGAKDDAPIKIQLVSENVNDD